MATINIGSLTFTHKGDYASGTAYVKNDVVYYSTNGNAYIAKTSTTGNAPTSTSHWDLFAAGSGGIWNAGLSLGSAGDVVKVNSGGTALEFGSAGGGMIAMQTFTSSGTYTKNAATTKIKVIVTGGGGGGGSGSNNYNSLSGGGAGGTAIKFITTGIGSTETVTVGQGGAGATAGNNNFGTAGGTSSFGSHCSATGGHKGNDSGDPNNAAYTAGIGSNGDINIRGGSSQGYQGGDVGVDYAGGSMGGSSFWGGGGMVGSNNGQYAGQIGQAYGSGGGAGDHDGGSTYGAGGAGRDGIVVVEEYA